VLTPEEALQDPQVIRNEMVIDFKEVGRSERTLGFPVKLTGTPAQLRLAPPTLGEHTRAILSELQYDETTIQGLYDEGVVQ
jgi:crotonobetainyl-CoA:carnitine CoA-transferase CaiB-like acyl-CoA transferase